MEPTCHYCNECTKFRCRTDDEAKACQLGKDVEISAQNLIRRINNRNLLFIESQVEEFKKLVETYNDSVKSL